MVFCMTDWMIKKTARETLTSMKAEFKRAAVVFKTSASLSFIPGKTNSTITTLSRKGSGL